MNDSSAEITVTPNDLGKQKAQLAQAAQGSPASHKSPEDWKGIASCTAPNGDVK